jgi:hypothetical protein
MTGGEFCGKTGFAHDDLNHTQLRGDRVVALDSTCCLSTEPRPTICSPRPECDDG